MAHVPDTPETRESVTGMADPPQTALRRAVTLRAVAVAAILAPLNSYWIHQMVEVQFVGNPTVVSLYFNVLFILCGLLLWNAVAGRVAPRLAFASGELLTIYLILSVTSSCSGYDFIHWMVPNTAGVHYRATPENRWHDIFFEYLPQSLTMGDPASLKMLYEGGTSFYATPAAWQPWIHPLSWWIPIMALVLIAPSGLAVLLRRRWIEVEKLTFPIIQLPFELTRERGPFLRDRTLWIAFGVVAAINLLNGLHVLNPAVPPLPLHHPSLPLGSPRSWVITGATDPPWNAAAPVGLSYYPAGVGFGLLLPTELIASCWVFYLFFRCQLVAAQWLGLRSIPDFPFQDEQSYGGYIGIILFALWASRGYVRDAVRRLMRPDEDLDAREPIPYRAAAVLLAGGLLALVLITIYQGMGPWQAVVHWLGYYLVVLIVGRMRAEMGLFTHELYGMGPTIRMGRLLGRDVVGARSLTVATTFHGLSRGFRSIVFPHQIEGLKLAERARLEARPLFLTMLIAAVLGVILAWAMYLPVVYHYGAGTARMGQYSDWYTTEAYGELASWLENPRGVAWNRLTTIGLSAGLYVAGMFLKTNVGWWPIHPLGFALSTTYAMQFYWFPLFVAWALKWLVTRYAGHRGSRQLVALAFGLILGDCLSAGAWTLYGALTHRAVYTVLV